MAFNPIDYIKESKAEFDKVIWPTPKQTIRLTLLVILISFIVGVYVGGLDALFATLTERFLR